MATTINSGVGDTGSGLSNRLKIDMHTPVSMLDPDVSQFSTMLMDPRIKSETLESYKKEWLEDRLMPVVLSLAASAASAASGTADVFTTGTGQAAYANTGDIIRITQSGEAVRVTGQDGAQSLSVIRNITAITGASAASGSDGSLIIVQNTNGQGAGLPTRLITQQVANYNYGSIPRASYGFTRTDIQSATWLNGTRLEYEREKKAQEIKGKIENGIFFGARAYSSTSDSGHPRGSTGGLIDYIGSSYVTDVAGQFDKADLQAFLTTGLQAGSNRKVLFAAPLPARVMSALLQDNWIRADPGTTYFGAKVNAVISGAFGTEVPVVVKRQWGAYGTGTTGQYGSMIFMVDLDSVALAWMQRIARLQNRQDNDVDGVDEEYLAEFSFVVQHASDGHHSLAKNITS